MTVAGDAPISNGSGYALLNALNDFRGDVREDIAALRTEARSDITALEGRLMTAIVDNRRALTDYSTTHNGVHVAERKETEAAFSESRAAHDRFDEYISTQRVVQARKDGALGVTRYVVELVAANAGALVKILLAAAVAAIFATGGVHLSVGV